MGHDGVFQTVNIRRDPETIALSSPRDASGLFELSPQPQELLLPFEGMGVALVATRWELRMPKAANQLDYSTIADVLLTIEYTALDDYAYRQQVVQRLDTHFQADRAFSFRHQFADAWYDLHSPRQSDTPMTLRFTTRAEDFPPNVNDLQIDEVLLYFSGTNGHTAQVDVDLYLGELGGEARLGEDGVISTLRNGATWGKIKGESPVGEWELSLPNTGAMRSRFEGEGIEDILFVITYSGRTPEWPA